MAPVGAPEGEVTVTVTRAPLPYVDRSGAVKETVVGAFCLTSGSRAHSWGKVLLVKSGSTKKYIRCSPPVNISGHRTN